MKKYDIFETSQGFVAVVAGEQGILRTTLPEPTFEMALAGGHPDIQDAEHDPDALREARGKITRYLAGDDVDLNSLAIDFGTSAPFFKRAWTACRGVGRGEMRSYAWLAGAAGSPLAVRAAGQAMARNRLPLLIPCHRIIGSAGSLHGFGGTYGVPLKRKLLEMEGALN